MLLAAAFLAALAAQSQLTTNTLTFSGATWGDGGSLDGSFTVEYSAGTPLFVLSMDVLTGNGPSDGFIGFDYLYNVPGQANTVVTIDIDATQPGHPANELYALSSTASGSHHVYLDWQGSIPTSLYLGNVDGEYSSENYVGSAGHRTLNTEGGVVPEPSTLALAGLGGVGLLLKFWRRK